MRRQHRAAGMLVKAGQCSLPRELHRPLPGDSQPGGQGQGGGQRAVCRPTAGPLICSARDRDLQLSAPPVSSAHNQLTSTSNFPL